MSAFVCCVNLHTTRVLITVSGALKWDLHEFTLLMNEYICEIFVSKISYVYLRVLIFYIWNFLLQNFMFLYVSEDFIYLPMTSMPTLNSVFMCVQKHFPNGFISHSYMVFINVQLRFHFSTTKVLRLFPRFVPALKMQIVLWHKCRKNSITNILLHACHKSCIDNRRFPKKTATFVPQNFHRFDV